jgi:hypothetical protein
MLRRDNGSRTKSASHKLSRLDRASDFLLLRITLDLSSKRIAAESSSEKGKTARSSRRPRLIRVQTDSMQKKNCTSALSRTDYLERQALVYDQCLFMSRISLMVENRRVLTRLICLVCTRVALKDASLSGACQLKRYVRSKNTNQSE